jgi:hypothetical protein
MSNELKNLLFPRSKRIDVLLFLYRHQDNEDVDVRPCVLDRQLDLAKNYGIKVANQLTDFGLVRSEKLDSGGRVYSLTDKGEDIAESLNRMMTALDGVKSDE